MKKGIALAAIAMVFVATTAYAAPVVSVSGESEAVVKSWETKDDFGYCNEVIYTFPISVLADEAIEVLSVGLEVQDADGNAVMDVDVQNSFPLDQDTFTSDVADVAVPCAALERPELWSDDFVVDAGETEDFNAVIYFIPETAGEFTAVLTDLEVGKPGDEANDNTVKRFVYNGGGGACLNCDADEEETPTEEVVEDEEQFLGVSDTYENNLIEILGFIQLLIDLGFMTLE